MFDVPYKYPWTEMDVDFYHYVSMYYFGAVSTLTYITIKVERKYVELDWFSTRCSSLYHLNPLIENISFQSRERAISMGCLAAETKMVSRMCLND